MKYEYQAMPTERKRSFKVVAEGKGTYRIIYMNTYVKVYSPKEIVPAIKSHLKTIDSWADELNQ